MNLVGILEGGIIIFEHFYNGVYFAFFVEVMIKEPLLGSLRNLEKSQLGLNSFFSMFLTTEVKWLLSSSAISLGLLTVMLLPFWIQFITLLPFFVFKYINYLPDFNPIS